MEFELLWTQGKCDGEPHFASRSTICFQSGSFIKFSSIEKFKETSIHGPCDVIQCLSSDITLSLVALGTSSAIIYIINYPNLETVSTWTTDRISNLNQIRFSGVDYLLILEGAPNFDLTIWKWKDRIKVQTVPNVFPKLNGLNCIMSTYPEFSQIAVVQENNCLHFLEIEHICETKKINQNNMYLPTVNDNVGSSCLRDEDIESIPFLNQVEHEPWGIHSEMLHKMPLKMLFPEMTQQEIVTFYDWLTTQDRLQVSCHCWLPDKKIIVASTNGTILIVTLCEFSVKIIFLPGSYEDGGKIKDITCMALNKTGIFVGTRVGDIFLVADYSEWLPTLKISMEEALVKMKFCPNYENLLFLTTSGSIVLYETSKDAKEITYMTSCSDEPRIAGIFATVEFCITAKSSGLIEIWEIASGAPVSSFVLAQDILCMEGVPFCSMLLISSYNSHLYILEYSDIKLPKVVHTSRPSAEAIYLIQVEPCGRFAVLVSEDSNIFLYSTLPSKGFEILGYFSVQNNITDIAIQSTGMKNVTSLYLLSEKELKHSCISSFQLPEDIITNHTQYWEDLTGMISKRTLKFTEIDLQTRCNSIACDHSVGLVLCLSDQIISVSYEKLEHFSLDAGEDFEPFSAEAAEKRSTISHHCKSCRLLLSYSYDWFLHVNDRGDVDIRNIQDFKIMSNLKLNSVFPSEPCITLFKDMIFFEGLKSILLCYTLSSSCYEKNNFNFDLPDGSKVEDEVLFNTKPQLEYKPTSWIYHNLLAFNEHGLSDMEAKHQELEEKFQSIENKLKHLVEKNFSVRKDHQIKSEKFIFEEDVREQMMESRQKVIEVQNLELEKKLELKMKLVDDIRKECIDDLMVKGTTLKSLRDGPSLKNYSICTMSELDKVNILNIYKKLNMEICLENQKHNSEETTESFESLKFGDIFEEDNFKHMCQNLQKQPFQLQSIEERVDYVYFLKYIIFGKRLAFNHLFDDFKKFRIDIINKIKQINGQVTEILSSIGEKESVWEPVNEDEESDFEVRDKDIEAVCASLMSKKSEECKGLADDFLQDDWVLKRKQTVKPKYQPKLKKENIERHKKDVDRKLNEIDDLVNLYEKRHKLMANKKLMYDLDINQDELQLFLLWFSNANFSYLKLWVIHKKIQIEEKKYSSDEYKIPMQQLDISVSKIQVNIEKLRSEIMGIDSEVQRLSKGSRNKQEFLEAYNKRADVPVVVPTLNPYTIAKKTKMQSAEMIFRDLNTIKNKPQRVSLALWKHLCSLREKKYSLETEIEEETNQSDTLKSTLQNLKELSGSLRKQILQMKENFKIIHEKVIRCNFETPMVLPISDSQLEMTYPGDLDFRESLLLKKYHVESLNCMITNSGRGKLEMAQKIAKTQYQIERNEAKIRIEKLMTRDTIKEIDVIKSMPLTKDVQKIIQDPKGFRLQDKIGVLEKSKQLEMHEYKKQMEQVTKRIANIDVKKDILRRSLKEKKKEIDKLEGDIAELRKIGRLKMHPESNI